MCGIAALIAPTKLPLLAEQLYNMLNVVRHRGPDDEGWAAFDVKAARCQVGGGPDTPRECFDSGLPYAPTSIRPSVARGEVILGHRRLAILDVSPGGHQPMCYAEGKYWIVFNGEIYNHRKLRDALRLLGHSFKSSSDTEIILAAYAEWGDQCLSHLEGMFAFVLVDLSRRLVLAARDRFGIKPLYYRVGPDGTLAFASEIKQFSILPGWRAQLNGQRAYDFLAWGVIDHTDETLFDGVFQVRPGTSVGIDLTTNFGFTPGQRLPARAWYRLAGSEFEGTFESAAGTFQTLFRDAVDSHLHADVPVGSCLSGGLDSSSIVCMARHLLARSGSPSRQHTFSACSDDPRFDERQYIQKVVDRTGTANHYVFPELPRLFEQLDLITWHQDEPFGSTSIYAQWEVFSLAAATGVKVLLDGQGADEQLAGYRGYYGANFCFLLSHMQLPRLVREIQCMSRTQGNGWGWAAKYLADAMLPAPARYALRAMIGRETASPNWLDVKRLHATPSDPIREVSSRCRSIRDLSYRQLTSSNLQMLLHWEDRNSMAHSIEARVPFLDSTLVEFVLGLPDAYKLSDGITKRVLREGLRGIIPDEIRARMSKLGFATPEEVWVRRDAPDKFRMAVRQAVERTDGIIRPQAVAVADDIISGKRNFDFLIWRIISFSSWISRFAVVIGE